MEATPSGAPEPAMLHPIDLLKRDGTPLSQSILSLLRGGQIEPQEAIRDRSRHFEKDPFFIPIGSVSLPQKALFEGIAYVGSSGSGKSVGINQIKRNRLAHVGRGHKHRVFIWDHKGRERCFLEPLELACPVHYINPLDRRGVGIDLAAELTGPLEADGFAADVIAPAEGRVDGEDGSTFQLASQAVFAEVIKVFQREAPGDWTLMDVLQACRSERDLRRVLPMSIDGEAMVEDLLSKHAEKQAKGIMLTLRANFNRLLPVAAASDRSENISLKEWVEGAEESVLVLQNVDKYQTNLAPFFRWVFKHTLRLVMSRERDRGETYTYFIDEARWAPFADELLRLATEGREYRAGFVLGFQDVQGLMNVLGQYGVGELFSCCSTQVWFQNNNPETAKFASERFGTQLLMTAEHSAQASRSRNTNAPGMKAEDKERILSKHFTRLAAESAERDNQRAREGRPMLHPSKPSTQTWSGTDAVSKVPDSASGYTAEAESYYGHGVIPGGAPISESETLGESVTATLRAAEYPMVYPSEVLHLRKPDPLPGPGDDLVTHCYISSTFLGNWKEVTHAMQHVTLSRDEDVAIFRPRPDSELVHNGWTEEDVERLGIWGEAE